MILGVKEDHLSSSSSFFTRAAKRTDSAAVVDVMRSTDVAIDRLWSNAGKGSECAVQ